MLVEVFQNLNQSQRANVDILNVQEFTVLNKGGEKNVVKATTRRIMYLLFRLKCIIKT